MALVRQSEPTLLKDLKFIQLKTFQISSENPVGSNCLQIDHQTQKIFVCCNNQLICVPLVSLLNFDVWCKSFLKHFDDNISSKIVIIIDNSHIANLLSISRKGYGTKLAVACHSSSQSSAILYFYNLDSFEETKEKTVPFNHFNFAVKNIARVSSISWHPDMSDNIFACSLSDGSFYIIYIGDFPAKNLVVLYQLFDQNVSAFCWSPKGKQIVISHGTSSFVQYKFHLNEQNLVLSNGLQETKRIQLPQDFQTYSVSSIFWLSTFNFVIVGRNKQENETCYILVTIPSSKATGPDAIMKIIDFGRLIIECNEESNEIFESNICPLDNLLFLFVNKSSEFAIIGSTSSELTAAENWCEITNDDDYRLMFSEADDSLQIRGLIFAHGTPKQFQLSTSIVKGGINQPFALAYNSLGHLVLFLIDYENGSDFIKVPVKNPCSKPKVMAQQSSNVPQVLASDSQKQSQSSIFNQKLTTSSPKFSIESNQSIKNEINPAQSITSSTIFNSKPSISSESIDKQSIKSTNKSYEQSQSTKATKIEEVTDNVENLYLQEIANNIKEFNKQLFESIDSSRMVLQRKNIASSDMQYQLQYETRFIAEFLENLSSSYASLNQDIIDLQTSCLELQYLMEESREMLHRRNDPKYKHLLQRKNLDPITTHRIKEMQSLKDYIEIQLRELNNKFDLEWKEWLQRIKILGSSPSASLAQASPNSLHNRYSNYPLRIRSPPTSPHTSFIRSEQNLNESKISSKTQNIASFIYKALANNQRSIENLKLQIAGLMRNSIDHKIKETKELNNSSDVRDLIHLLDNVSLIQSPNAKNIKNFCDIDVDEQDESIIIQCMNSDRKKSLRNFLENRHSFPIRICRPMPFSSYNSYTNKKSRFASVLEKIKDRQNNRNLLQKMDNSKSNVKNEIKNENFNENRKIDSQKIRSPEKLPTSSSIQKPSSVQLSNESTNISNQKSNISASQSSTVPTFSFKLPQQQLKQSTTVVTVSLPKFHENSAIDSSPIVTTTSILVKSTSQSIVSSNANNIKPSFANNTSSFDANRTSTKQQVNISTLPNLSSLLSSSTPASNNDSKSKNDSIATSTPITSNPSSSFGKNLEATKSSISVVSTNLPTAITTQTVTTTSSFSSTKIPSFSASMFENVAKIGGNETKATSFTNSFSFGGETKSIFSKPLENDQENKMLNKSQDEKPAEIAAKSATDSFFVDKPKFNFGGTLKKEENEKAPVVTSTDMKKSAEATIITTKAEKSENQIQSTANSATTSTAISSTISFVPQSGNNEPSFMTNLKSTLPSFSSSLFGDSGKPQQTTVTTTTIAMTNAPIVTTTASVQQPSISFNFNNTLSSLSLNSGSNNTTATTTTIAGNSIFSSPFGAKNNTQSQSNSIFGTAATSSLFSNNSSNQGGGFGSFSFGGTAQPSIFAQQQTSTPQAKIGTIFGQQQQQSPFSLQSSKPFQPLSNTSPPTLQQTSSPPTTNVFGGSPLFGGSPTFGSPGIFGSQPSVMMSSFTNTNHSFGSLAFKNEPMPSFDSLANDNKNMSMNTGIFGQGSGGGGGGFFNSKITQQNSDAFTQRRG